MLENKRTTKIRQTKTPPSEQKIKTLLRSVPHEKAFHFYSEMGKPTGKIATSVLEFSDIIKGAESEQMKKSLAFHQKRGDFAKWVKEVIDDTELAEAINKIKPDYPQLKSKLSKVVNTRIDKIREALMTFTLVPEDVLVSQSTRSLS